MSKKFELVSGPSVRRLSFIVPKMLVGLIVVVVIFAVVFFTFRHALDGLPLLLMWGFIIGYQVVIWATVGLVYIQRKRETTRGYTSVPNVLPELPPRSTTKPVEC